MAVASFDASICWLLPPLAAGAGWDELCARLLETPRGAYAWQWLRPLWLRRLALFSEGRCAQLPVESAPGCKRLRDAVDRAIAYGHGCSRVPSIPSTGSMARVCACMGSGWAVPMVVLNHFCAAGGRVALAVVQRGAYGHGQRAGSASSPGGVC